MTGIRCGRQDFRTVAGLTRLPASFGVLIPRWGR